MSLNSDIQRMVELVTAIAHTHQQVDKAGNRLLDRIHLSMEGHPQAAAWDNGPRSTNVFCAVHECDIRMCHQEGWGCVGYPHSHPSDPTGDAALRADRAADDERLYRDNVSRILRALTYLADTQARYPAARTPNAYERQLTADRNAPHCDSCSRHHITKGVPWIQDVYDKCPNRTTVGDVLTEPMYLCRFCYDHVWSRGCLPNMDELKFRETYQGQDRRLRCPHPKLEREDVA